MRSWSASTRSVWELSWRRVRGHDVIVLAAAMAFFSALAVVPLLIVTVRLTAVILPGPRVQALAARMGDALPAGLGARSVVSTLIDAGLHVSMLGAVLAVVPVTVYGEGLRRVLLRLQGSGAAGRDAGTSWRGRVSVVPLVLLTPVLLVVLLLGAGLVADLQDRGGGGSTLLGVVVGYYTVLVVLLVPVGWTFRVVAAGRLRVRPLLVGSFLTAASLAGFCQGLVIFLALPLDLGAPLGGLTAAGGAIATGLWLFLLHLVLLLGFALTLGMQQQWHPETGPLSSQVGPARRR